VTISKYRAVPTIIDNIRFASKAEARRYGELKLLEKAGRIEDLELQPSFPLHAASSGTPPSWAPTLRTLVGHYRGDFRYRDVKTGKWITEDVKGLDTPMSRWKRKHVAIQYGITVEIVR
jgi:hypothetical protein